MIVFESCLLFPFPEHAESIQVSVSRMSTMATGDEQSYSSYSCTTKNRFDKLCITWTIEDARFHLSEWTQNSSKRMSSAEFRSQHFDHSWSLEIANDNQHPSSLEVRLQLKKHWIHPGDRSFHNERINYSLSILSSENEKVNTRKGYHQVPFNTLDSTYKSIGSFIKLDELLSKESLLPNDTLTLFCEVKALIYSYAHTDFIRYAQGYAIPNCNPEDKPLSMFKDGKYADVIIEVGGREIKAHKFLLAAHSSVFEAMFDSDMLEKSQNRIVITDLEYEDIEQMLEHIYTWDVPKLHSMADRLLKVADKYALKALLDLCERWLCNSLAMDNVIKRLRLAELHNSDRLKVAASKFISDNIDAWKEMTTNYSLLSPNLNSELNS